MRAFSMVLLLCGSVFAENGKIAAILNPTTAPGDRLALIDEVIDEGDVAELARAGLDPKLDAEVVHAIVAKILAGPAAADHLDRVCRLLTVDALREKVIYRLRQATDSGGDAVIARLRAMGAGETPPSRADAVLRVCAARALGAVPRRAALEAVVEIWAGSKDTELSQECARALEYVLGANSADEARERLRARPLASYYDFMEARIRSQRERIQELSEYMAQALRNATPEEAFKALRRTDKKAQEIASERLRQLAESGELAKPDHAKEVFDRFNTLRGSAASRPTLANLVATLTELFTRAKNGEVAAVVPLHELLGALGILSDRPADWQDVGVACVQLLKRLGPEGVPFLVRFAKDHGSADVRREATDALRFAATQNDGGQKAVIGRALAQELLPNERDPGVRKRILYVLQTTAVPEAVPPLRALLFPEEGEEPPLPEEQVAYCITILDGVGTPEALLLLERLATEAPTITSRLDAVRRVLDRARAAKEPGPIFLFLQELALSGDQPPELRDGVIQALGKSGQPGAADVLLRFAQAEELDVAVRTAARAARLTLAETLIAAGSDTAPPRDHVATAARILEEEYGHAAPDRLTGLARSLVEAAARRQHPAFGARYLLARLTLDRADAKPDDVLRLFEDAALAATKDGLAPQPHRALLLQYRTLLKKGTPPPLAVQRAIQCSLDLAGLAANAPGEAVGFRLDAAADAVNLLADAAQARKILQDSELEGLDGDLAQRVASIRTAIAALQKPAEKPPEPPSNGGGS